MRLIELFPEDLISPNDLLEAGIRDYLKRGLQGAALGGALAAGVSGYGTGLKHEPQGFDQKALASLSQQAVDSGLDTQGLASLSGEVSSKGTEVHPGFPKQLINQDKVDPKTRVENFAKAIVPYIDSENAKIKAQRTKLIRIVSSAKKGVDVSKEDRTYVNSLMSYYKTKSLRDLLDRVDVIPPSLALAQAAIESAWGQDEKAKQGNVFYGQKTWSKVGGVAGPEGEKYSSFESPAHSVMSYMRNLNTNPAYDEFRALRAKLRHEGEELSGMKLAPTLKKYSTRGTEYTGKLLKLISGRSMAHLDAKINENVA